MTRGVLVGAGHAHLYVAARAAQLAARGARVTLIDPGAFWYSGRATAMLGAVSMRETIASMRRRSSKPPAANSSRRG